MPYYGDALPYYYGGPFSNHSSLMTGTGRTLHSPLGSTRYAPHLTTISESPLSALRRYSPAAVMTSRPKRIIDTADIDVSTPRALSSGRTNNEQRNRLRRDRPTIRIRSQALKDNPALREHYERHEKTVGELLVEKFLIKDKKAKTEDELRTKLYSQVSLEDNLTKEQRNELQEAIQRRITRRMTRRRSSADVHMDPEQIEREVLFAQAQADVLDTLVAEEQAEIEVEARMGTLIRKNLVRTAPMTTRTSREVQGTSTDDADDPITKKLPKKVKKRKKITDKPSPPSESDFDSERDATRTTKVTKDRNEEVNDKAASIILGLDETIESPDEKTKVETPEETPVSPLKFKIEASNSVGDFSTLWINASISEEQEEPNKHSINLVEQFRDSVRLPAPKQIIDKTERNKKKDGIVEEHQQTVVIPVKKRYVKDDARNSVYLTLKTQKSANSKQMAETNDKIDRIEAIDDTIVDQSLLSLDPSSTIIKGKTIVEERSKNISSMPDDATSDIKRQQRVDKVAKFRSKDITESDVEVKSISESSAVAKGKIGTKDVSLQNSSGIDDDTHNAVARASISETSKLDKNEPSVPESTEKRSDDRTTKPFTVSNVDNTYLKTTKTRDADDNIKININSQVPRMKPLSMKDVKIPVEDPGAPELRENGAQGKSEKPLVKRAKKIKENAQEKSIGSITDETKRLKRNVPSSLDFSNISVRAGNSEDRRNNGKKQQDVSETKPNATGISSTITNLVESLPNASTINIPDTVDGLTIESKIQENSGIKEIENAEEILPGKPQADKNVSPSQEIEEKMTQSETLKPIGLLGKNTEVNNLIKDVARNIVELPATFESSKILPLAKNDVNLTKNDNDEELTVESAKKLVALRTTPMKDDNDSVEISKLRNNCKVLVFSSRNDGPDVQPSSPNSSDFRIVPDPEKNHTVNHEPSATKVDEPSSPNVEKLTKGKNKNTTGFVALTERKKDSVEKRVEAMSSEPSKLTNGISDKKPETIVRTKKPATDSKTAPKLDSPWGRKEEEIDFWGEIANEEIPGGKLDPKIGSSKEVTRDDCIGQPTTKRDGLGDSMVTVLETKSEALPESGTGAKTERPVCEKKSNKVKKKKKKLIEDGECKKKDKQEKVSAETIFERLKISDEAVHEESHQRAEGLEQRSKELTETSVLEESEGEKNCVDPAFDKFERNLSTILEESSSPISEKVPKSVEAFDLIESSLIKGEKNSKLDITENSSSFGENSERIKDTLEKEIPVVVSSCPEQAKAPLSEIPVESEKPAFTTVILANCAKIELPLINIIVSTCTPSEDEIQPEVEPEVLEDETEEDPGTPTNETIDDAANNIAKWHGHADLSLDEPSKDIGPVVVLRVPEKATSDKNKTVDSKKISKKSTNSTKSTGSNQDSSKKKKIGKKKKSSTKNVKVEPDKKIGERSSSKTSNSSDATLKPNGQNLIYSPMGSGCNSPKQRPLDLIKMFYTTPASLLTATPRDLSKVRRAKIKKRKHSSRTTSASSDSTGSTRSTQSTGTAESTASTEHEDDTGQKRISSTRSNDSGFDGSPRLSNCDMACHKKCEKLTGNLCGLNQKLVAEALQALKRAPSQSSDNQRNSDGSDHHASGRVTPPATNLPRFKKYTVTDFNFLKVLGKGSFGKVLLAELRRTDCVYAVKCLKKDVVLEDDDVECTLIERKVLTLATRHPYLCHLFCTFQTDSHLFFVMEYLNGGDLMFHIQKSGRFAESRARFYAAEIWSGLNFLHKKGIVYRDLKLDNVLLDFEGHIRIADFGMCKLQIFLDRTADTFCGTPDYMAPEIIKGLKYNQAVDWWSFGVLLYEMLTGQSPFSGCDEDELFWSICNERPFIPRYLSQEAMDVLICLLEKDAGKRPPAHEISVHPFFHSLQWDRLERRQLEPPFKPALEHTLDTRYFDTAFTAERPRLTPVPEQILTSMDQGVFRGFSYTNPNATD